MNTPTTFSFNSNQVRTLLVHNEPHFVLSDICRILELSNPTMVAKKLDEDERTKLDLGRQGKATVINESGLYAVILRSDKPQAKQFRKWVTSDVLPTLRKTGNYSVKPTEDYKTQMLETRKENIRIRKANLLYKVSKDCKVESYREVLQSHIAAMLTGEQLLPLPKAQRRVYSAAEVGDMLNISANRVGHLTNAHGLKTAEFGEWVWDKSKYSAHECRTFRYYIEVVAKLKELLKEVA